MIGNNPLMYPQPPFRKLRAFAFDPSLNTSLETALFNQVTLQVPWEPLQEGPVGEYLEVVDIDPASGCCYPPINLDEPFLLAQDGLPPSEGSPQFHQQMVYAVASSTIQHFEKALGRKVLWTPPDHATAGADRCRFLPRLRVYPHALREANAYYSPAKKAILFGYFPASSSDPGSSLPGGMVFTCLSHDIIAHELTHALLESLHPLFIEPSNVDVLALHEAFADIVALFQHFTHQNVLTRQIARTRGDLESENLLGELAQEFGQAIGSRGALRSALGERKNGRWQRKVPDPNLLSKTTAPHARGAILLAAVFDAFLTIYKARTADLMRIATGGTGVLPSGDIHPDLVDRLAGEAAKTAAHILKMCIRAMDYVPPVDITFGDYLRALITADHDMVPNDPNRYRLAFVEAFRRHGIYPLDVRSLSEESLLWNKPHPDKERIIQESLPPLAQLRRMVPDWWEDASQENVPGKKEDNISMRKFLFEQNEENKDRLHQWLTNPPKIEVVKALGLNLDPEAPGSIYRDGDVPSLEVHSMRPAYRVGPDGRTMRDLVIEITQTRRGYDDPRVQEAVDKGELAPPPDPDFIFRGGVTLLFDLEKGQLRYAIYKRISSERRLEAQRRFLARALNPSLRVTYFGDGRRSQFSGLVKGLPLEPFALLHRHDDLEEV
jgi:hypothetical protein